MKKNFFVILIIMMILPLLGQHKKFPVPKIDFNPKKYLCFRALEFIEVDGKFDEYSWLTASYTDYFVDIEGPDNPEPYYQTRVKMLWDDKYFYVAAELQEEHIWAKLKTRDAVIYYDNDFEIFIDPDGDTHNYYELEVNAFETIWDLLLTKPYRDGADVALNAYDMRGLKVGIDIKGTLNNYTDTDKGWNIEIAIPWSVMKELHSRKVPPNDGDQWRINFSRVQWETEIKNGKYVKKKNPDTGKTFPEKNWVWSPQGLIAMHYPEMWGIVEFSYQTPKNEVPEVILSETDKAKWYLRKIYYMQKEYYENFRIYAMDLKSFAVEKFISEEYEDFPVMKSTGEQYKISLKSKDGSKAVSIFQDGQVILETKQVKQ